VPLFLEVASGRNAGLIIPVKDRRFLIGRADDCDLRAHSDQVSRYHCAILIEDHGVFVRDYGSRNGTFVNGARVASQRRVVDGTELRVGPLAFVVRVRESGESAVNDTVEAKRLETVADSPKDRSAAATTDEVEGSRADTSEPFDVLKLLGDAPKLAALPAPPPETLPTSATDVPAASSQPPSTSKAKKPNESVHAAEAGLKRMFSPQPPKPKGG
jgi:pSer/pThr/pTyr-binding forkhead associated (FHA) protein